MKKFRILLISIFCFMIAFDVKAAINTDSIIKARTSSGNPVRFDNAIKQGNVLLDETIAYDYAFTFGYDHNKSGKYLDAVSGAKGHGNHTCTDASSDGNCGTSHDFQQYFISTDHYNNNYKGRRDKAWACYSNIGEYNGKQVDVKGVVNKVGDSINSNRHIFALNTVHPDGDNKFVYGAVRPGVTSVGTGFVTVTWSFTEHKESNPCGGAPINNLKGHTAYVDIDWSQGIIFHDGNPKFYISSNVEKESFYLGKVDGLKYIFNGSPDNASHGNGVASNKSSFMEIFDTGNTNHITRTYTFAKGESDNYHGSGYIGHYANSIVKIEDPYNYSLDIACTNCESKNSNGKSIVIQDTTNWKAILNSTKVANGICGNSNLSNYYKKTNDGVYCREEYHISYPNENSRIKVEQGRFFTLNAEQKDLNIIDGKIPNYKSIKVTKIRECRGGNLISFKNISDSSFKQSGGAISIDYNEKTYKYSDSLKSTLVSSSSTINNNNMLVQKAEFNYTLKDNVYRYIRIRDNYSMKEKPNENDNDVYKDNLVSNLPISLNSEGAEITFNYSLPSGDQYSKISTAFGTRDYLKCSNTVPYNIYKDNNASESELEKTACGKLFGSARSQDFNDCRNKMKNNRLGNCLNDYSCTLNTCNEKTAGKGEYEGKKWNPALGKCEDKTECTSSNYSALGRSWNETLNKCCSEGTTYSRETGKCLPDGDGKCEPENKCELLECAKNDRPCCVDEECGVYCGYKENGEDICPGKSNINNFIYRVIDPIIPFISQKGDFRKTGDNWCSNSKIGENVFSCEHDNPIVKTVITDDPEVSEDDAMYMVELNSETITSIRNYNKVHKYDDFTLSCNSDGRACKSKFLREEYTNRVSGKCIDNTSFYNC